MVESDLEGPWVKADHAFDVVAKGVPEGEQIFRVISSYDDIRYFLEKVPGYEPGDTLMLVAPLLLAHGVDDRYLREVARMPENTRLVPGARDAIKYVEKSDDFYLISTSYQQYVSRAASLLGVPEGKTFSTAFPIDDLRTKIEKKDSNLVRDWAQRIAKMPSIEVDESESLNPGCIHAKESLDEFFWEILPETSFATVMEEVKPVGGTRKYEALARSLEEQGKSLNEAKVIGDSITDSVMLSRAREAGGLALSFNGNRYSIVNSNVAVMSGNCWITASILEIWDREGPEGVKEVAENWGLESINSLGSEGVLSKELVGRLSAVFSSEGADPRVHWIEDGDVQAIIRESEAFRKRVRGTSIGELG